jgi:NSS family neurotransmitter:Na+ symporter
MGAVGRFVGLLFFVALLVGALTSAISLLEVVTSSLIDNWKLDRARAALGAGLVIMILGIPSAYNQDVLGLFDKVAGEFLLVVGAFFLALLVGWRVPDLVEETKQGFGNVGLLKGWLFIVRIVVPIVLAVVIYQVGKQAVETVAGLL